MQFVLSSIAILIKIKVHMSSIKFYITIDTEEDNWSHYSASRNTINNISKIPILQNIFDKYGAIPTYLVNWPVAVDKNASSIFKNLLKKGKCEIGTHCHPWNTPPIPKTINSNSLMLSNLSHDLIYNKISRLHSLTVDRMETHPACFRSGRWAFSSNVAKVINELGYKIDTSISPFIDWSDIKGPNFSQLNNDIYKFSPANIFKKDDNGSILEVPATVGYFQKNVKLCHNFRKIILKSSLRHLKLIGILEKLRILNFRWLSPELSTSRDMIRLTKALIRSGQTFLNFSFHSTSLYPGSSPFVKDELQLQIFLNRIDKFLQFASNNSMHFLPLSAALNYETN